MAVMHNSFPIGVVDVVPRALEANNRRAATQ
jgi:hypothetical protein